MNEFLRFAAAVVVFILLWVGIGILPLPKDPPDTAKMSGVLRSVLYVLLIVAGVWWLWTRYVA